MTVVTHISTNIHDLDTLSDPKIKDYIKKKLANNDISLIVSPQIYKASISSKEDDIVILTSKIDAAIHRAAGFFEKNPPLNNTEALFAPTDFPPAIIAIKDIEEKKHLNLITTRDLCVSLGWSFVEPTIVKSTEDLMTIVFKCIDMSNMKLAVWMKDTVHKLYTFDIGFLLGLYIPEENQKIMQEVGKAGAWYWLLKQTWAASFGKETACLETYIDRIYEVFK